MNKGEGAALGTNGNEKSLPNVAETEDEFDIGAKGLSSNKKSETERNILDKQNTKWES